MVKETSATESTSPQAANANDAQNAANSARPESAASNSAPQLPMAVMPASASAAASAPDLVTTEQLKDVENKLSDQIAQKSGGKTGLLWVVTVLALAAAGFAAYTSFQNQQTLTLLQSKALDNNQKVSEALVKIENSAATLEQAQIANSQLLQNYNVLVNNYNTFSAQVGELKSAFAQQTEGFQAVSAQVQSFAERNPNDWKLAESFFLVNNATSKAIFEKDLDAAIWMLTQADQLLIGIEDAEVVSLRESISRDIAALNNVHKVDVRGMGINLDRAYDNVDQLVLEGYADPKQRAAAFNKAANNEPSADIKDWKENLVKSATDFASRFVEVRRRNAEAATEFLTPEQDLYLRENIKTRILLAKADLGHGEKEAMQANLKAAIGLISTYFSPESEITTSTLAILNELASSEITIQTPKVLESTNAFSQFAQQHLMRVGN